MANNCTVNPDGTVCLSPSDWSTCPPYEMSEDDRSNCYVDSVTNDALEIAGAQVNVFKLLGVHEQTKLVDLTGNGRAISGGDAHHFPAANAFTTFATEWQSKQSGSAAVAASAYIGYDFGVVKLPNGRQRYGIDASVRQQITTIKIKQSSDPLRRATKARIERSENGKEWYGVAIVTLPNDDALNTIHFKHSVPNRYWRLRPVQFVGTNCDGWGVQALEMYDYSVTHISNIQDKILMENRDRDYQDSAITLKGYYDLVNVSTDLSRFGIEIPTANYQIKVNFNTTVMKLGRPVVIGDIIELPSETQYTPDLRPVKRFLEVTDVTWDATTYTPGWRPTMLLITAQPALATQETQDIFGDLAKHVDNSGLFSTDDGNNQMYQDYSTVSQTINQTALSQVPERGSEGSNTIRHFSEEEIAKARTQGAGAIRKMNFQPNALYVEDGIPQNGAPYTEGPTFPDSPKDGDYHRVTYPDPFRMPAVLNRWSAAKQRWIYMETDRRQQYNDQQPVLTEYTTSKPTIFASQIK